MPILTSPGQDVSLYGKRQSNRHLQLILWSFIISAILAVPLILLGGNVLISVCAILLVATVAVAWMYPRSTYYVMLVGACLIETYPLNFKDSITDQIPLFWDVNTAVQVYGRLANFHGIGMSFFECYLLIAGVSWVVHGVVNHTLKMKFGTLIFPILLYLMCVFFGLLHGLSTGGTFNIALFEVRAQLYFFLAYLMAVNCTKEPEKQLATLLWAMAVSIGTKAVLATYRFVFTLHGTTPPEAGIGSHEESFFFNCFVIEYLVLKLTGLHPRLRQVMLILLPFVILGNLANQRRAATAAMVLALIALLPLAAIALPKNRRAIMIAAIALVTVMSIYLPIFWNGTGTFAQPARAIKSQFDPDPRDASSNEYRDAENSDLMFTMRTSPIFGYGYGKLILEPVDMVDLSSIDPLVHYMTHNQILWIWMRLGSIGFYAFWVMMTANLMQNCRLLHHPNASLEAKAAALFCVIIIIMLMVFGLLDMQISNPRNMLFCGLWVGTLSVFSTLSGEFPVVKKETLRSRGCQRVNSRWNLPAPEGPQP